MDDDKKGLSDGAKIGIGIAAVAALIGGYAWYRSSQDKKKAAATGGCAIPDLASITRETLAKLPSTPADARLVFVGVWDAAKCGWRLTPQGDQVVYLPLETPWSKGDGASVAAKLLEQAKSVRDKDPAKNDAFLGPDMGYTWVVDGKGQMVAEILYRAGRDPEQVVPPPAALT
jgi:hypothetical protein